MTKGKALSKAAVAELATVLSTWDGKKHILPEFTKAVTKWASANGVAWILNAGRALFNYMQTLQEDFKRRKKVFKPFFADHNDAIWEDRTGDLHGRVFRRDPLCIETPETTTYVYMAGVNVSRRDLPII